MQENNPIEQIRNENDEETITGLPYKVILFNDDVHTFEEVIAQLVKAVKCSFEEARNYAFETHVKGKAVVYFGTIGDCLKVTSILEEIELHTQILS